MTDPVGGFLQSVWGALGIAPSTGAGATSTAAAGAASAQGPSSPTPVAAGPEIARDHWVPDEEAPVCGVPGCTTEFNLIERRHHCRRCGEAVCSKHFTQSILLNERAIPDPHGWAAPVCADCVATYRRRYGGVGGGPEPTVPSLPPFALPNPGRLVVPTVLTVGPNQELYLASVISHVGDILAYLTRVRDTLAQSRDSGLRREYMETERDRLARQLVSLREHELFLNPLQFPQPHVDEPLRGYIIDCMYKLQEAKAWANSSEVTQLMNGIVSMKRGFGELPEDDITKVEARVTHAEQQAEALMATLFDLGPAEQQAALRRLRYLRARMVHDFWEYKLVSPGVPVPSMQLEPFRRRLESSTNYIDMHIEMCASDADHGEMNKTVTDLEQKFYTLLSDVETTDASVKSGVQNVKKRAVDLTRDVAVMVHLLEKKAATFPRGSPLASSTSALLHRPCARLERATAPDSVIELQSDMGRLEETLKTRFAEAAPPETLEQSASVQYRSIQRYPKPEPPKPLDMEEIQDSIFLL